MAKFNVSYTIPAALGVACLVAGPAVSRWSDRAPDWMVWALLVLAIAMFVMSAILALHQRPAHRKQVFGGSGGNAEAMGDNAKAIGGRGGRAAQFGGGDGGNASAIGRGASARGGAGGDG